MNDGWRARSGRGVPPGPDPLHRRWELERMYMQDVFQAVPVTDRVWWVGAIDWSVRDFHGYLTSRGTTYNAFLVRGDRWTLIDTVKAPFFEEMMSRVASVVDPARIEVVVSNHSEPDHSGGMSRALDAVDPDEVYASIAGMQALEAHYRLGERIRTVKDGDSIDLGGASLQFATTPMCHWPDSMVSYLPEQKLLFSQDAFGMHLAGYERFDDQVPDELLDAEAAKYYANILLPLSRQVAKAAEKLGAAGWDMEIIAPDHGPIWREKPEKIVGDYVRWARQERTNKAVVVYDTMWESTQLMARAVGEGLAAGGAHPRLMPLSGNHRSDVATELLDAGALLVGAPTINNQMFPTLADCLSYVKGLKPVGLLGAAFGSHGWSGEGSNDLRATLESMDVEIVGETVRSRYVPTAETLGECYRLGEAVGQRLGTPVAAS